MTWMFKQDRARWLLVSSLVVVIAACGAPKEQGPPGAKQEMEPRIAPTDTTGLGAKGLRGPELTIEPSSADSAAGLSVTMRNPNESPIWIWGEAVDSPCYRLEGPDGNGFPPWCATQMGFRKMDGHQAVHFVARREGHGPPLRVSVRWTDDLTERGVLRRVYSSWSAL